MFTKTLEIAFEQAERGSVEFKTLCELIASELKAKNCALIAIKGGLRSKWVISSDRLTMPFLESINNIWYMNRHIMTVQASNVNFLDQGILTEHPEGAALLSKFGIVRLLGISFKIDKQEWLLSFQFPPDEQLNMQDLQSLAHRIYPRLQEAVNRSVHTLENRWARLVKDASVMSRGVVLFDADMNMTYESDYATKLLLEYSKQVDNPNILQINATEHNELTNAALRGKSAPDIVQTIAFGVKTDLVANTAPVPMEFRTLNQSAITMMFIYEVKPASVRLNEVLKGHYELTKTEIILSRKLFEGLKLKDAAEQIGMTIGNARQHLKRIFKKLEVETQHQLVVKLMHISATFQARLH